VAVQQYLFLPAGLIGPAGFDESIGDDRHHAWRRSSLQARVSTDFHTREWNFPRLVIRNGGAFLVHFPPLGSVDKLDSQIG